MKNHSFTIFAYKSHCRPQTQILKTQTLRTNPPEANHKFLNSSSSNSRISVTGLVSDEMVRSFII